MTGEKFTLMQYSVHAILGLIDTEDFVIPEIQWTGRFIRT